MVVKWLHKARGLAKYRTRSHRAIEVHFRLSAKKSVVLANGREMVAQSIRFG